MPRMKGGVGITFRLSRDFNDTIFLSMMNCLIPARSSFTVWIKSSRFG